MARLKFIPVLVAAMVLFTSCSGTVDGKSPGEIADKAADKVGGWFDSARKTAEETNDNALDTMERKLGPDVIDPEANMSRQDYRDALRPKTPALRTDKYNEPAIPDVSQLMIAPAAPTVGKDKLITLNVTEDVPLKEVLVELARRADIDIELDPSIRGGIIFRAKDRPFSEVIDRIAELTGLRYSVVNGVLKVERDFPYVENYQVDFLNIVRSNSGEVNITTQVLSSDGTSGAANSAGKSALASGSSNKLTSQYEGDLWKSVEENVKNILALYGTVSQGLNVNAGKGAGDDGLGEVLGDAVGAAGSAAAGGVTPNVTPQAAQQIGAPARTPNAAPRAAAAGGRGSSASGGGDAIIPTGASLLSINKQAGLISVLANQRQHREVKKYLDRVKMQQSAQVLIEAKVVEVTLNDQHRSGIDWSLAMRKLTGLPDLQLRNNFSATPLTADAGTQDNFFTMTLPTQEVLGVSGLNLEGFIQFAESFGVTRTLSSPRINAVNNQQAVLTFARNLVYFQLKVQEENRNSTVAENNTLNIDSQARTVPLGVILSLQPSINLETNEILMNVRPTLSRQKGSVADPAVTLIAQRNGATNITSEIPIVEVRELDSIIKIKSGQVMVIGGLMEERVDNRDTGIPVLSDLPFAGNLFKRTAKNTDMVETVIFIKATIVPGYGTADSGDKQLYRKFTNDRHPLTF